MKKLGLLLLGGIAALVLIANLGSLLGLAISLVVLYFVFKQFLKTDSTMIKVVWAIIGLMILVASASNVPAILGIAAAYVLYLVYKKWNAEESPSSHHDDDPFANFEKQWAEINK